MPRTIETIVYRYDELTPEAREKARLQLTDTIDYSESLMCHFVQRLHAAGYPTLDINYSLNYCQGDGMAFFSGGHWPDFNKPTGVWWDLDKGHASLSLNLVRVWFRRLAKYYTRDKKRELYRLYTTYVVPGFVEVSVRINRRGSHRYTHYNSMEIEFTVDIRDREALAEGDAYAVEYEATEFELNLADDVKDISKELEKEGYAEIEYQQGDANVAEYADANDYEFTRSGKLYGR